MLDEADTSSRKLVQELEAGEYSFIQSEGPTSVKNLEDQEFQRENGFSINWTKSITNLAYSSWSRDASFQQQVEEKTTNNQKPYPQVVTL